MENRRLPAGENGLLQLALPAGWREADALALAATDRNGQELWTWKWETKTREDVAASPGASLGKVESASKDDVISLTVGNLTASFRKDGQLPSLNRDGRTSALRDGPRVVFARPAKGDFRWMVFRLGE
jgi:hypothetical protein